MKIKVCGLSSSSQIISLDNLGIDFLGLIFYKPSPRYFFNFSSATEFNQIPLKHAQKVGVFVNEDINDLISIANQLHLDFIQLHGNESPDYCTEIKKHFPIIKAFSINSHFDDKILRSYESIVDYFLFDTQTAHFGGSGKSFDWNLLQDFKINNPFFLSGGISIDDVDKIQNIFLNPKLANCLGIDINSRFEISPSIKDIELIKIFQLKLKN